MPRYAQIDQNGRCVADSTLAQAVEEAHLLPLDPESPSPLGMVWDGAAWQAGDPEPAGPIRVTKADFQRLLAPAERYAVNALRKSIAAIPPGDYSDPSNALLLAAEDVLLAFEQPAEFIELDHPDTAAGLTLLGYLDVFGTSASARIAAILAGQAPA